MLDHDTTMPWRRYVVTATFLFTCWYLVGFTEGRLELDNSAVEFWASTLGELLNTRCRETSGIKHLEQQYRSTRSIRKTKPINGTELVLKTAKRIESFLDVRYNAAWKIKRDAEEFFLETNKTYLTCSNYTYYNSKTLQFYKELPIGQPSYEEYLNENITINDPNSTYFLPLYDEWRKYYQVPVSLDTSAIHVPTNVYDCSPPLLEHINWTESLDSAFNENYQLMPSAWQYFASSSGFMRFFPAAYWSYDGMDMYDARLTEWYTGAASTPKSVIILLDNSGSMTGLRMEIAKNTVRKIMESLQENDFFNLITFSNDTKFVDCNCSYSNGTLIQATSKNIRRVSDALINVTSQQIANFSKAFTVAFDVLNKANSSGITGGNANNAIMVITDGAPESYEKVFTKYNWENVTNPDGTTRLYKWTRVFSYLIGQEVTLANKDQVRWMACANKGYFYHIGTMADVHDYVQDYLRVMARPLAVANSNHFMWTGVHVNMPLTTENNAYNPHAKTDDWIRIPSTVSTPMLTISVAMPVYDLREDQRKDGNLLGVAGVDVNLEDIISLFPRAQLGVFGYAFIINNNGFVVTHPYLTPWSHPHLKENKPKPDYKNVDLSQLEQEEDISQGNIAELRMSMINREVGSIEARVLKFHNKDLSRVYIKTQTYYYAPISNTPYSIAVVRIEPLNGKVVYTDMAPDSQSFDRCRMIVADWNYCQLNKPELANTTIERIQQALSSDDPACDKSLARAVVYDANVTRSMDLVWHAPEPQTEPVTNTRPCSQMADPVKCEVRKHIAESMKILKFNMVLLGTRSGVTRYQELDDDVRIKADEESCSKVRQSTDFTLPSFEADYYTRAAATAKKGMWTLAAKVPKAYVESFNSSYLSVTASAGIYIEDNQRGGTSGRSDILASVLGLDITFDSLYQMFEVTTSFCTESMDCEFTNCSNPDVDCYLLDENGYIVVAEDTDSVGTFFGDKDYQIMVDMRHKGLFQEVSVTDYQALCTVCNLQYGSSSASSLLNPFRYMSKMLSWYITKIVLFLMEFSLYDLWHCVYAEENLVYSEILKSNKAETYEYLAVDKHTVSYMSGSRRNSSGRLQECMSCKVYTNSTVESLGFNLSSSTSEILFVGDTQNLTEICETTEGCNRSYVAHRVSYTNLYLLVLEGSCRCNTQNEEYCIAQHELQFGCTSEAMQIFRRPPPMNSNPVDTSSPRGSSSRKNTRGKNKKTVYEDMETCGRASVPHTSLILVLLQLLVHWMYR